MYELTSRDELALPLVRIIGNLACGSNEVTTLLVDQPPLLPTLAGLLRSQIRCAIQSIDPIERVTKQMPPKDRFSR